MAACSKKIIVVKFIFSVLLVVQSALAVAAAESQCSSSRARTGGKVSDSGPAASKAYFEQLVTTAERLRRSAAAADAEWLKTEGLIRRSREEAAGGNWSTAIGLAQKACFQASLALQQAARESAAWQSRVVH